MLKYLLLSLAFYFFQAACAGIFHLINETPFPITIKGFIKLTFAPYVLYALIFKPELLDCEN